jgi:hypothetical protein
MDFSEAKVTTWLGGNRDRHAGAKGKVRDGVLVAADVNLGGKAKGDHRVFSPGTEWVRETEPVAGVLLTTRRLAPAAATPVRARSVATNPTGCTGPAAQ